MGSFQISHIHYTDPRAPELFVRSFRETGFAVITDHPISAGLIRDAFAEWERFFANDEKYGYKFDPAKQTGYFPFRSETAKNYSVSDLKEFYHYYPLKDGLPPCAKTATPELYRQLEHMGVELLGWLDQATPAEVRARFSMPLKQMIQGSRETLLRPIHYPALSGDEEIGAIRAAAHEDINLITLLPAATTPGLEVRDVLGKWHQVPCSPGEIVVNSGDMLQKASGHYFKSTTHRVVNPTGSEARFPRYSMPLFVHPRSEVRLSDDYTAGSYLRERLGEIGLLKESKESNVA